VSVSLKSFKTGKAEKEIIAHVAGHICLQDANFVLRVVNQHTVKKEFLLK